MWDCEDGEVGGGDSHHGGRLQSGPADFAVVMSLLSVPHSVEHQCPPDVIVPPSPW